MHHLNLIDPGRRELFLPISQRIGAVGSETVRLELNPTRPGDEDRKVDAGDKPGQFRPEPESDVDYRYIVMPMHL